MELTGACVVVCAAVDDSEKLETPGGILRCGAGVELVHGCHKKNPMQVIATATSSDLDFQNGFFPVCAELC